MPFTRYSRSRLDTRDVVAAGAATREGYQLTGAGLVGPFAACPWAVEREKARKTHYPSRLVQGTTTTGTTEFSTISQKNDYISTSFNK